MILGLIENESLKILRRKRFRIVLIVLAVLLALVVFAQDRQRRNRLKDNPTPDWRAQVEKRASELERQLNQRRVPENFKKWMRYESGRLRYHLVRGINPNEITGPVFTRGFAGVGSVLLIPLLIAVFGADLVSSEFAEGTITLLLTRPVARWKVMLSKVVAMMLFTSLTLLAAFFLAWGISGVAFGWSGWGAPMLTGFRLSGSSASAGFDLSGVRTVPLWQDTFAAWGLAWFSALAVGSITLLLSVVFRSAAAAMGTMMATLVGGTILSRIASDWDGAKWFFVTNLPLPDFYAGLPTPFEGMTLAFSVWVLLAWAAASLVAAFLLFTRRDVTA
ncbi:MAG TPA: ABC transporter permease [Thermoanaerobaculia bacterium]|nr:ABC transporter permease [Thermoanaerobaculia bacterium]